MPLNMFLDMVIVAMAGKSILSRHIKLNILTGNLHLNVVASKYTKEIQDALEPYIFEVVCK